MLKGTISLTPTHGSVSDTLIYHLQGYDINGVFDMLLQPGTAKSKDALDYGYVFQDGTERSSSWGALGLNVKIALSKIRAQKLHTTDYSTLEGGVDEFNLLSDSEIENLPKVTNTIDKGLWAIIGSLIRGLRSGCIPVNRVDYMKISNNFSDFNSPITYEIGVGTVTLRNSFVDEMKFEGEFQGYDVSLHLANDGSSNLKVPFCSSFHDVPFSTEWALGTARESVSMVGADGFYSVEEIVKRNVGIKSYDWLLDRDYQIVTPKNFKDVVKEIYAHGVKKGGLVSFDTETTGLFISNQSKQGIGDQVVGLVFSIREGQAWYFPLLHTEFPNIGTPSQIPFLIERYITPILERSRILTHNGSFDWKAMHIYGINTNIVADTRIAAFLTVSHVGGDKNESTGLKYLTQTYLGRDALELDDFVDGGWGSTGLTFANLPYESTRYYACADTDNTLSLWNYFERTGIIAMYNAKKEIDIECLFTRAVGYSEFYGMYANSDEVHELAEQLLEQKTELENTLYELAGERFKVTSPKDKNRIFFDKMKIPVIKMNKTGPSTDKKSLKTALTQLPSDSTAYKFLNTFLEFQKVNILYTNFATTYDKENAKIGRPNFVNSHSYSGVSQFLETGRLSVNNPNYQSYNDVVKKYITARPGYYTCDFDFSAIEYRVLVSVAGETKLIEKFRDPDYDYHRSMASMLHGVPYDEVTPKLRSQSKGLNFGIPYGMSVPSLAQTMGVDVPTAQVLYDKYFEVQPRVKEFFNRQKDFAVANLYNETHFGRRRTYDKRRDSVSRIRRQAGNHPIQGTAADIYKIGIGRLFLEIVKRGYMGKVLLSAFVHDEAVIECHESINPAELLAMVQKSLMVEIDGWCPLYIGCGFGESWYDAKKIELPVQVQNDIIKRGEVKWWDGDRTKLKNWALTEIFNFKVNYLKDYLKEQDNWHKPLNSVAFGHLSELLAMVSDNTAYEGDAGLVAQGVGTAYTEDMLSYSYHRSDVLTNLGEFGRLFGCEDLVATANIINPATVEAGDGVKGGVKSGTVDVVLTEDDPVEVAVNRAVLSGASIEPNGKHVYVALYQGTANTMQQHWNEEMPKLVSKLKDSAGTYSVVVVKVNNDDDTVELQPYGDVTLRVRDASKLMSLYQQLSTIHSALV